jgi:hypothetical protein
MTGSKPESASLKLLCTRSGGGSSYCIHVPTTYILLRQPSEASSLWSIGLAFRHVMTLWFTTASIR